MTIQLIEPVGASSHNQGISSATSYPAPSDRSERTITTAMRHLLCADEVSIYVVDLLDRIVEPLDDGLKRGPIDPGYSTFLAEVADGDEANGGSPIWVPAFDNHAESMVVRVVRRGTTAIMLVADFRKTGVAVRTRALRVIPDLVTLLRHHVRTEERVRTLEAENMAMKVALDHGECGVAVVDAAGCLLFANSAAKQFLDEGDGLHLQRGTIRPTGYAEAVRFRAALDAVTDSVAGEAEPASARRRAMAMLLPSRSGSRPTILAIAPCDRKSSTGCPEGHGGTAILYILPANSGSSTRLDIVCRLHGLSRTEARLLTHLVNGLTLAEAAGEIRVKLETARAYLKQVFAKTGTHRQVDAVALVSRYARAMRGEFDFLPA